MSWIDRINEWVVSRIQPDRVVAVYVDELGLRIIRRERKESMLPWDNIQEISAVPKPALSTGVFSLAIRTSSNKLIVIDDTAAHWSEFCAALPEHLSGASRFENWSVHMLADAGPGQVIYKRNPS